MEAFFITIISAIIINICSARTYNSGSSYSSSSSPIIAAIIIPIIVGIVILVVLLILCKTKCCKKRRTNVLPLSTQIALAQQENQYAPPSYNQAPPYSQPPSYEQPPPYSAPNVPTETTKGIRTS